MNILAWALFGLINGLLLYKFTGKKSETPLNGAVIGMVGAITGGSFAMLLFRGLTVGLNNTLSLIFLMEMALLFLLMYGGRFGLKS